jgi:hypothetical protein
MSGRAPGNVTNNGIVSEIAGSTVVRRNDLWGRYVSPHLTESTAPLNCLIGQRAPPLIA